MKPYLHYYVIVIGKRATVEIRAYSWPKTEPPMRRYDDVSRISIGRLINLADQKRIGLTVTWLNR